MPARVATAAESAECERRTIQGGTTAAELMNRAGSAAASEILRLARGVESAAVVTGPGNNGGDGWVVAGELAAKGVTVRVVESAAPKTPEAESARASSLGSAAASRISVSDVLGDENMVVDALLGTGAKGAPHGRISELVRAINDAAAKGATVFALDLPTGVDADSGVTQVAVGATHTLTFGLMKRGALLSRDCCGSIAVLDIGLTDDGTSFLPLLIDGAWAHERVPPIRFDAHKGTRGRVVVFGGGEGMAGAAILVGMGALRTGAGLVHLVVHRSTVEATHAGLPEAIVSKWPKDAGTLALILDGANAIVLGPGLGKGAAARDLVERVLLSSSVPTVVDADALNAFSGDAASLASLLRGHQAVMTPHPAELGRVIGIGTWSVVAERFDVGTGLARETAAALLLKGTPTVVFAPDGARYVSAAGTAALATGGSGDVLSGIVATLLAHTLLYARRKRPDFTLDQRSVAETAAAAAFFHGRAAELCGAVRGTTLSDILRALHDAWNETPPRDEPGVLVRLPHVP
jgi:NAD(P)H-hydrate epimerase